MPVKKKILNLFTAHLVNDIYTPVIMAIQPVLITSFGYSYFIAALLPAMHSIVSSLFQPIFGHLADKKGLFIPASLSILLSGVGISLLGLFPTVPTLMLVCVAIAALGHASFHPGALFMVHQLTDQSNRGRLTSIFVVGGNLGFAIGPLIAGALLAASGLPAILILIIPAFIGAVLIHRSGIRLEPVNKKTPVQGEGGTGRGVAFLFAGSTLRSWVIFGSMTFFPTFLVQQGYTILIANILVTGMLLAGVVGQLIGGIVSDRYGRKQFIVLTTICSLPAYLMFLYTGGLYSLVALIIFGFLVWSSFSVTIALSHELMPARVGLTSGLFLGLAMGAGGIGVAASGLYADQAGLMASLELFSIIIVAATLLFLMVPSQKKTKEGKIE